MGIGKMNDIVSYISSGLGALTATLLDDPIARYTLLTLSIISALAGIVSRVIAIIQAKKGDGKIDLDDIKDIVDEAKDAIEDAKDDLNGKDKKK